jgi:photosystem II CP43 chlorophyll apoprotein
MTATAVDPAPIAHQRAGNVRLTNLAYFVTVNSTVYPEAFYGSVGLNVGVNIEAATVRTWLATSHFVLAVLLLSGHIWHAIQVRAAVAGIDLRPSRVVATEQPE